MGAGVAQGGLIPDPLQSLCQLHAFDLTLRRAQTQRGRHFHHTHFPEADAACQLTGILP